MSKFPPKTLQVGLLSFILLTLAAVAASVDRWIHTAFAVPESSRELLVRRGDSLYSVAKRIDPIADPWHQRIFVLYGIQSGMSEIKQGEYRLPERLTPKALLQLLTAGKVTLRSFTWVEGTTVAKALKTLLKQPYIAQPETPLTHQDLVEHLGLDTPNAEGWLFPDTYSYTRDDDPLEIVQQAYERMQAVLEEEWEQRADNLPYSSPYEALIMASIIEKETGAPQERAEIAGVFVRRLQKKMRLQTDPTIIYGMGDNFKGNIKKKHLREPTPYNTYVIKGLPPTPIALPGQAAIHAALHPAPGDALYFVAKGDGTHHFSATLKEHEQAVRKYQLKRAENYRSSLSSR